MDMKSVLDNPKTFILKGLRKLKTKSMLQAVTEGVHEFGNHRIEYDNYAFFFYYRGTCIYEWRAVQNVHMHRNAGEYEDTLATMNQRREISQAILLFKRVVDSA